MTKKNVRPVQSKKTWGLVQADGITKLQWELKKAEEVGLPNYKTKRSFWKSDWRK